MALQGSRLVIDKTFDEGNVRPTESKMNRKTIPTQRSAAPTFWREAAMPYIEARSVEDGRKVCYAKHAHDTFSIGAINGGRSTYLNGTDRQHIGTGALVVINPEDVHACNPIDDAPWSYLMLYVDVSWLTALQHEFGTSQRKGFGRFSTTMTIRPDLHAGLNRLYRILSDEGADILQKESAARIFFGEVQLALGETEPVSVRTSNPKLARAAEFIRQNFKRSVKLDEICVAADLSPSYLIRAFKQRYGMTPHAYLVNCRIEYSRSEFKQGRAIADVAAEAGFADQAHLQRAFRQFTAATPSQYRG